jgi:hypothetical protein
MVTAKSFLAKIASKYMLIYQCIMHFYCDAKETFFTSRSLHTIYHHDT